MRAPCGGSNRPERGRMPEVQADLLRLLELAHPGRPQADLLRMIEETPDAKVPQKPVRRVVGARPRTPASVERRRSLASQGWFPPSTAARFTVGEQAALVVIAQEVARHGACGLFIEKIAALAGVTRSTVKRALKEAHGLGMIRIEERRLTGWRNDANVVTIVDPGWLAWLNMRRRGEGSRKGPARNTKISNLLESRSTPAAQKGFRQAEGRVIWRELNSA
jgi:AraC-like DNA-binding protein